MNNKYDLAIFDLDGTLLDTSDGVLSAVQYTVKEHGLKPLSPEELESFIGPPVQRRFKELYQVSQEQADEYANTFRNQYKDADLLKATPYKDIFHVFQELIDRGIKPAIATYKRQDYTDRLLHYFGFDDYTDIIYGSDFSGELMKSDIIQLCVDKAGVKDKARIVMIGDTGHDAIGAQGLDMDFIGVTYGFEFHCADDVKKYNYVGIAETTKDIMKFV
ncbi:HAD family hydrolase [Bacteroides sp.]|uniref:HAD family hydrolase n=1 Tax=Bacteroides sp. TaxID=29523 RepID=UPI00260C08E2|nr:HAD hydrolase-like protein [Bacteroides sp.]MDD3040496.1 HAD hydrolase-like protein [Bacteroides sp.]